jgi:hypothetical protein
LGAISFVVRVVGEPEDVGRAFPLMYSVVDADARPVGFRQELETRFEPHPIDPTRTTANVVTFRFYGFPVPDFGTYLFEVHSRDERLAQVPFWVVPVDAAAPPDVSDEPDAGSVAP